MAQMTLHDYLQETEDAIAAGRLDDALAHCQQILAQFPGSLEANRLLGEVYLAQGRLEEAQQSFDWVLMNDPENVVAYCNRALVCQKMSDVDTALDCYQQAYELSGGDSAIRKQFNQLSAQVGQPPFMYSRAGLARLYMRGDLLSHALLEWEAVLAAMPDRLDARLGLLETYWRRGNEEKVAQLSARIVEDVPECLKALVLLAYTTAPRDSQKAHELLQRAQALDPEMVMAQELFADTMASQPAHPFFMLWKKTPVLIDLSSSSQPQPSAYTAPVSSSAAQPAPTDSFSSWSDLGNWGSLDTLVPQKQEQLVKQEAPVLASWGNAEGEGLNTWRMLEQRQTPTNGSIASNSPSGAAWSFDLEQMTNKENVDVSAQATSSFAGLTSSAQTSASALSWEQPEPFSDGRFWENAVGEAKDEPVSDIYSWFPSPGSNASSNPPSWLNMLAQSETSKSEPIAMASAAEAAPLVSAQSKQVVQAEPLEGETLSPVVKQPVAESVVHSMEREVSPFSWDSESADDEESFGFGPEWLKTLGATTLDDTEAEEIPREEARQTPAFNNERSVVEGGPTWQGTQEMNLRDAWLQQPAVAFEDWTKQIAQTSQAAEGVAPSEAVAEELTTLESLEQRLHAQGFVPLEPNTLSAIAQSEEVTSDEQIEPEVRAEEQSKRMPRVEEKVERDFSLSSALAQFGPLPAEQAPVMPSIPAAPVVPAVPASVPPVAPAEPARVAAWQQPSASASLSTAVSTSNVANDQRQERIVPSETRKPTQNETKMPVAPAPAPEEVTKVPAARAEALMDSELEMTMRRPAVRV